VAAAGRSQARFICAAIIAHHCGSGVQIKLINEWRSLLGVRVHWAVARLGRSAEGGLRHRAQVITPLVLQAFPRLARRSRGVASVQRSFCVSGGVAPKISARFVANPVAQITRGFDRY